MVNKVTIKNGLYQYCDDCKENGTNHYSGLCRDCRKKNKVPNSIRLIGKNKKKPKFYEQEEDVYGV